MSLSSSCLLPSSVLLPSMHMSLLSHPYLHGFSLGGLPLTQFFHMTSIQFACLMFISRASLVGGILLLVLLSMFLHRHSCFSVLYIYFLRSLIDFGQFVCPLLALTVLSWHLHLQGHSGVLC